MNFPKARPAAQTAQITNISPATGPDAGGTTVRISMTRVRAGATVLVGGVEATVLGTSVYGRFGFLDITTPAGTAGDVDVVVNDYHGNPTSPVQFTYVSSGVSAPATPTNFRSTSKNASSISLAWDASATATDYKVYASTTPGFTPGPGNLVSTPTGTTFAHSSLAANTDYYFRLIASNTGGDSAPTSELNVKTDPAATGLLFSDDFETGALAADQNGCGWEALSSNVIISSERAFSGTHSMKLSYQPKALCSDNQTPEQRFFVPNLTEAWIEFMLYIPTNFFHRIPSGCSSNAHNNKLLRLWGPTKSSASYNGNNPKFGASFDSISNITGNSKVYVQWGDGNNTVLAGQESGSSLSPFIDDTVRGTWVQMRFHAKLASNPTAIDGRAEMWVNGVKRKSPRLENGTDVFHATGSVANQFAGGYLMGWANSGYTDLTEFFIDDVKIYGSNPGWV